MEMTVLQCKDCHKQLVPIKYTCPSCLANEFTEVKISGIGSIYSFTTVHIAPETFADNVPYDIILVELENRLRVTARLQKGTANIGESVKLVDFKNGIYWFTPLKEGEESEATDLVTL